MKQKWNYTKIAQNNSPHCWVGFLSSHECIFLSCLFSNWSIAYSFKFCVKIFVPKQGGKGRKKRELIFVGQWVDSNQTIKK